MATKTTKKTTKTSSIPEEEVVKPRKKTKGKHYSQKYLEKLAKKQRKRVRRRIVWSVIFAIMIVLGVFAYQKIHPIYTEMCEQMFTILSSSDHSSFMRSGNTEIYDSDGNIIGKIGNEKYKYVEIENISEYITNGYIAKEDRNFLTHPGIDVKALARAAIALVKNKGTITQGGSTITQQVIKNNFLTQAKTYERKILEVMIALQLEKEYNKAQIMEFYCNSNYYGNGCYGVEGASQYYFGKSAKDVTLGEAAILVATSNSPNNYNPVVNYELSLEKRDAVLDEMLECGYITESECALAKAEEPVIVQQSSNVENENYMISYAIHCAALKVMENNGFEFQYTWDSQEDYEAYRDLYSTTYNETVEAVRTGGYTIYTSLDSSIQATLQSVIDDDLADYTELSEDGIYALQGAAVCVDNDTGMVVAIVGGRSNSGEYNRGYQAKRQSGSSIKPFLDYAPAFNEGVVTPGSILVDEETTVDGYTPSNAGNRYHGSTTVRNALVKSYNSIALQLFNLTGRDTCMSYLDKLHFTSLAYMDECIYATSIGGFTNGVTVVDMAKGYATLANNGNYINENCITSLVDYVGNTVYQASYEEEEVYSEDTAFMITDVLEGMFQDDGNAGNKYIDSDQYYAGKTGTTNDNKDAWFCGYSTRYSTAVWIGYDLPQEMTEISGGTYPAMIWTHFMDKLHEGLEPEEFTIPDTIKLADSDGNLYDVDYTSDIYASRPSDKDYYPGSILDKIAENEKLQAEAEVEEQAEISVSVFENFQILSIEDALSISDKYNDAYEAADKVSDQDLRTSLMNRIAYKLDLLNGDVIDNWNDAIDEYNATQQAEKDEENRMEAQKSAEKAVEEVKNNRIDLAEWYINQLKARTVYTSYIETLVSNAYNAVQKCSQYSEYSTLYQNYLSAKSYAQNLPTEDELNGTNDNDTYDITNPSNSQTSNNNSGNGSGNSNNNSSSQESSEPTITENGIKVY